MHNNAVLLVSTTARYFIRLQSCFKRGCFIFSTAYLLTAAGGGWVQESRLQLDIYLKDLPVRLDHVS